MLFYKYHALGNDYLVLDPKNHPEKPTVSFIQYACNRHKGLGSDGILYGPTKRENDRFGLQIFNPDGSEAEKSGNGLRIFARYLWDLHYTTGQICKIQIGTETATCRLIDGNELIEVDMGKATIDSSSHAITGEAHNLLKQKTPGQNPFIFHKASVGNPHCVVLVNKTTQDLAEEVGPLLEQHPLFPQRTNVQFVEVVNNHTIKIEIWERGAGYTLASGSSSCAAAAVTHRLGLCGNQIEVKMPGGNLCVQLSSEGNILLQGPVTPIGKMELFSVTTPALNLLGCSA